MKISGYTIERIHKNMYRIINADGQQVGVIERNKQASVRPGTGRWHARGTSKLISYKGLTAQGNNLRETLTIFIECPCRTYIISA